MIYLHANVDVVLARIAARARGYEQQIERTYMGALADAYERFFATCDDAPVLAHQFLPRVAASAQ